MTNRIIVGVLQADAQAGETVQVCVRDEDLPASGQLIGAQIAAAMQADTARMLAGMVTRWQDAVAAAANVADQRGHLTAGPGRSADYCDGARETARLMLVALRDAFDTDPLAPR